MSRVEDRLFSGATLLKTMDQDSATGAAWSFPDGETARADVCERLLTEGLLVGADAGLFPGMEQQYRLKPYSGSFEDFAAERFGQGYFVCNRRTKKLAEQYSKLVLRSEYAEAKREFDARRAAA